jgi:hypothetical protein
MSDAEFDPRLRNCERKPNVKTPLNTPIKNTEKKSAAKSTRKDSKTPSLKSTGLAKPEASETDPVPTECVVAKSCSDLVNYPCNNLSDITREYEQAPLSPAITKLVYLIDTLRDYQKLLKVVTIETILPGIRPLLVQSYQKAKLDAISLCQQINDSDNIQSKCLDLLRSYPPEGNYQCDNNTNFAESRKLTSSLSDYIKLCDEAV